jgi:hypothetical protein
MRSAYMRSVKNYHNMIGESMNVWSFGHCVNCHFISFALRRGYDYAEAIAKSAAPQRKEGLRRSKEYVFFACTDTLFTPPSDLSPSEAWLTLPKRIFT